MTLGYPFRIGGLRMIAFMAAVGAAGSCGDSGTGPQDRPAVATVVLAPTSLDLTVGDASQITATTRAADGSALAGRSITWSSGDDGIASVSTTGMVTAVDEGVVTITATSEGKNGTASVTVSAIPVATVEVLPSPATVTEGETAQLTATAKASDGTVLDGRVVTWASSDEDIVTVSGTGVVTGVAVGSAMIAASIEGKTGLSEVFVSAVPVASVEVTPDSPTVVAGQTAQLTAVVRAADDSELPGRPVTWATSAAGVATVSNTGLVTGVAAGTATITATSEGVDGSAVVTVTMVTGMVRTWNGGASGAASDWSVAGNWTPAGIPIALDTVHVPAVSNPAILSEDVRVARLVVAGGRIRTAGHRLAVRTP